MKTRLHAFAILTLILVGCATAPVHQQTASLDESALKGIQVEPPARSLFVQAERAFKAKKYKVAADNYRAIKTRFPGGNASQIAS